MDFNNKISVKPEIDRLINILEYVKKGRLVVPEFQRDYIWDRKQRIDLFDSIKRGFPIGSLLFWNPESNEYEYNDKVGPYKLNINPNKYSYIIDGYQRITTLFSALTNPEDESTTLSNKDKLQEYIVYYDLENQEFSQPLSKNIEPYFIPLYVLVDTFLFLTFSDELKEQYNEDLSTKYINRAKKLATTLLDYSIAFVNINGGTIQDSVEIFSRINSKGSDMSPMWMLSALTYNDGFKFSEEIEKLRVKLSEYNFDDLKTEIILQCVETATGKIYFDVKTESLAKREDFNTLCDITFNSILETVKFLYNELNVVAYKLLPYNLQLIFLTEFFRTNTIPTQNQIEKLKIWFWQTSYSNYFSLYSLSKQRRAFLKFQNFSRGIEETPLFKATNENFSVPEFPKSIYYGSVRSKTLALFLIKCVLENNQQLINNDLEDFYSLYPSNKDAEYMFPKFRYLDYFPEFTSLTSRKKNRNYSFLLTEDVPNFDYQANFITPIMKTYNDEFKFGRERYYLIKEAEKTFVKSLGDVDYENENFFDFGKYSPFD
ncbi:DUF262 domain-containing protein [Epilithonimonas pallida]|uniref:GmrSD restriction endonucleases N-terminal domain-containing protein n=1 Tax=Epilithonimonas pallida TaxID=373671 RepID=A0ABY1R5W1_9FLAO|nr:DUF262 domain-containing protein [Epilithonimonas pallida]SMP95462.1 Protein of unknown function DUF262 [Epilithonimonas pallida]